MFYLHEKYFKPNKDVLNLLNVNENEDFAIVRFVSWDASHDVLEDGLSNKEKISLVKYLSKRMKVFISSESILPEELNDYKFNIDAHLFHDALSFAKIYVGEGGTTASEAAILGVPSVYVNDLSMGYIDDEINAGLLFQSTDSDEIYLTIENILMNNDKEYYKKKSKEFISNKIDPTMFLVSFVEDYFSSISK